MATTAKVVSTEKLENYTRIDTSYYGQRETLTVVPHDDVDLTMVAYRNGNAELRFPVHGNALAHLIDALQDAQERRESHMRGHQFVEALRADPDQAKTLIDALEGRAA